ncbi:hypothetical protein L1049_003639 [Liquidambar formosana]|uniref:GDSL esterase/lipase n=1 Tax=Liquidambar formosana TaxID=63359 RepID=A0AAP0WXQ3_LIQFO
MGCVPAEIAMRSTNGQCVEELQRASRLFNPQLVQMIQGLNSELGSDIFVAANAMEMHMNFISNPQAYGFVTSKVACCGQGPYNGLGLCTGQQIGSEPTLPYLSPDLTGERLLVGANFASAGIGILNDTGIQFRLYELGARTVIVTGTGPLGCVPAELAMRSTNGECAEEPQRASRIFNPQLVQMIQGLNSELGSDIFVAANAFEMNMNFINDPQAYGFVTSKIACCGQGPYNGLGLCTVFSNLCPNRDIYAFWDPFHPSERANGFIVQQIMTGSTKVMNPMNLSTIMAMDSTY